MLPDRDGVVYWVFVDSRGMDGTVDEAVWVEDPIDLPTIPGCRDPGTELCGIALEACEACNVVCCRLMFGALPVTPSWAEFGSWWNGCCET